MCHSMGTVPKLEVMAGTAQESSSVRANFFNAGCDICSCLHQNRLVGAMQQQNNYSCRLTVCFCCYM